MRRILFSPLLLLGFTCVLTALQLPDGSGATTPVVSVTPQPAATAVATATATPVAVLQNSEPPDFSAIDKIVVGELERGTAPGAVVVVGYKGKVIFHKAYGMRSLEPRREPMTEDTIFDIASLTKPIATATSLMILYQEGKFRLNDQVSRYLPEFGENGKHDITIRDLATHYSGLPPDLDLKQRWSGREEGIRLTWGETLLNPPGAVFRYSDINYITLGLLVERLSGEPLEEYAQRHIFTPLKMYHTRFLPPREWLPKIAPTEYDENHVLLHGIVDDPTSRRMGGVAGHAGVFSTAADLSLYAQAMLDWYHGRQRASAEENILTPLTVQKMVTPQQPPTAMVLRGIGWDLDSPYSVNRGELLPLGSFGHTGFTGTSVWIDPYHDTYIIILTNSIHPHRGHSTYSLRTRIANSVAEALHFGNPDDASMSAMLAITGYNEALAGERRLQARNGLVLNGIDMLETHNFDVLQRRGRVAKIGLLTNQTGLDIQGRRTIDVLSHAPGVQLAALFSPEHGAVGAVDTTDIHDTTDATTNVPIYSVYGDSDAKRRPPLDVLRKLDAVVIDLQDAGVRFYTYETTLGYFLEAASKAGVEVVVLDRPNPINGTVVEGPVSDAGHESFTNYTSEPVRHGMTMGELARYFNGERALKASLTVVPMQGWIPGDWFDSTGELWVNPSPNLRSLTSAILYPGVALIEGTNVSVGRGTDTPFQLVGAPWIKSRELAAYLNARELSGVRFVPVTFTPQSNTYAGVLCQGVNLIVMDRNQLDSPELGIELAAALHTLYAGDFQMDKMATALSNQKTLQSLFAGEDPRDIADDWRDALEAFDAKRQKYLLYKK